MSGCVRAWLLPGDYSLAIETRCHWKKWLAREDRLCHNSGSGEIESEEHFLIVYHKHILLSESFPKFTMKMSTHFTKQSNKDKMCIFGGGKVCCDRFGLIISHSLLKVKGGNIKCLKSYIVEKNIHIVLFYYNDCI